MALVIAIAAVGSLMLTPLVRQFACRCDALSRSDASRKTSSLPKPVWGGIAVFLAVGFAVATQQLGAAASALPEWLLALGCSCGFLCLLGCYDDRFDMPARVKLLGQILATLPIVLAGCYVERIDLFGGEIVLGAWGAAWTLGWLVLGINAMNLLDGMDGLASLIGLIISATVALLAWMQGSEQTMLLAMALAGALAGFLVYNLPPAKIYLGDCGSMVIGLAVAFLALQVSRDRGGAVQLPMATALLFVPLLDTALAIVRRTLSGRSVMRADRRHIHHRLLDRGLSVGRVLGLLGGFCLVCGAVAASAAMLGEKLYIWGFLALVLAVLVRRKLIGHEEWSLVKRLLARTAQYLPSRSSRPVFSYWFRVTGRGNASPSGDAMNAPIATKSRRPLHPNADTCPPPTKTGDWVAKADKAA